MNTAVCFAHSFARRAFAVGLLVTTAVVVTPAADRASGKAGGVLTIAQTSEPKTFNPVMAAVDKILALVERLRAAGHQIRHVDFGGGLGIAYQSPDSTPEIRPFIARLKEKAQGHGLAVMVELIEEGLISRSLFVGSKPA